MMTIFLIIFCNDFLAEKSLGPFTRITIQCHFSFFYSGTRDRGIVWVVVTRATSPAAARNLSVISQLM